MRTLKLKLILKSKDQTTKVLEWKRLRTLIDDTYKAANCIVSGQYFNDNVNDHNLARKLKEFADITEKEAKDQIAEEFKTFYGTKAQATTERDIKVKFPKLPPCITNPLNQLIFTNYNNHKQDVKTGLRSISSYKKSSPIPTTKLSIHIINENEKDYIYWHLSKTEHLKFEIYYGKDKANNKLTIKRILDGINDYCAPQFMYDHKRDLYLNLPVKEPIKEYKLNPELSVGVDLGLAIPAYCTLSDGSQKLPLGSYDDFVRVRTQIESRKRKLQRELGMVCCGHGRTRKLKALDRTKNLDKNFTRSFNHYVSKKVIDFAIEYGASTIKLELLEGFGEHGTNEFILRNWSYFELQTLIEDKATRVGIKILYVDPYHTSQTCSKCGNYEEGQRLDQKTFKCKKCDANIHADNNASLNIARSTKYVSKKEDCEYYKLNKLAGLTAKG